MSNSVTRTIVISDLTGGQHILAGSQAGTGLFAKLVQAAPSSTEPAHLVILLNFAEIAVATASFLRESVLAFKAYCRAQRPNTSIAILNASEALAEELDLLLREKSDALLCADSTPTGDINNIRLLGVLDEKQALTFTELLQRGEVDANLLARIYNEERIGLTAWNNRLAALAAKGLIRARSAGRTKFYRAILENK